jgi:mevalonate kinase
MDRTSLAHRPLASASAKFLLSGEYSVLLSGPAIAVPLTALQLQYKECPQKPKAITEPQIFLNQAIVKDQNKKDSVLSLRKIICPEEQPPGIIDITTTIPIGKGLGSSAALCVAMARYHHPASSKEQIAQMALDGEVLFHGSPSGVDPYCVSFAEPIVFTKNPRTCETLSFETVKNAGLVFLLRDSGGEHSTKTQVEKVMSRDLLIHELVSRAKSMLAAVSTDASRVAPNMREIQKILFEAGASSPEIEANIAELYSLGAQGAKITGSGRGGFVVSVFEANDFAKLPLSVRNSSFSWQP